MPFTGLPYEIKTHIIKFVIPSILEDGHFKPSYIDPADKKLLAALLLTSKSTRAVVFSLLSSKARAVQATLRPEMDHADRVLRRLNQDRRSDKDDSTLYDLLRAQHAAIGLRLCVITHIYDFFIRVVPPRERIGFEVVPFGMSLARI